MGLLCELPVLVRRPGAADGVRALAVEVPDAVAVGLAVALLEHAVGRFESPNVAGRHVAGAAEQTTHGRKSGR